MPSEAELRAALTALVTTEPVGGQEYYECMYCEGSERWERWERSPRGPWMTNVFHHAPDCEWVAAKALIEQPTRQADVALGLLRKFFDVERHDWASPAYVDVHGDLIILDLSVDMTPDEAALVAAIQAEIRNAE